MRLEITIVGHDDQPAKASGHLLIHRDGQATMLDEATDPSGRLSFVFEGQPKALTVVAAGHWHQKLDPDNLPARSMLDRLPSGGPRMWWHEVMDVRSADPGSGRGIRIGIVDTGFRAEAGLEHVGVRDHRGNVARCHPTAEQLHGETVARLIGQRMCEPRAFGGIAPGASLIAIDASGPDYQLDPVKAVNAIVNLAEHHRCDLINLSAGHREERHSLREAVRRAARAGALCVAAAGNDSHSQVAYPARYPECVAVGGIGLRGWGPPGTWVRAFSDHGEKQEGCVGEVDGLTVFHHHMSCFGEGLDVVAPGVGLVVCRAPEEASSFSGTSFAAPLVTGLLAATLATDEDYGQLERGIARVLHARDVLQRICQRTGIGLQREGLGVPRLGR